MRKPLLSVGAVALLQFAACSGASNPAAPNASSPRVTVSVSPVPVPTQAQAVTGSPAIRYQVRSQLTFHDATDLGGRITRLHVALVASTGDVSPRALAVDLALPPGGTVAYALAEAVELSPALSPVHLRVEAEGSDSTGHAIGVDVVEVPLAVVGATDASPAADAVFVGAGDIAVCGSSASEATATVLDRISGSVFTLGDHVYPSGTPEQFANCYEPTWGRHRDRTHAAPGNHDWDVAQAAPYFAYFGAAAGPVGLGYYGFDLGAWRVLSLNSNVSAAPGSPQYEWVRGDLAVGGTPCTLAYWHHPLFSSGPNGNNGQMREMWRLLQAHGVELVLTGHDHDYERFAPQDADARADPQGIREFVVGTGGAGLYQVKTVQPNSEVRDSRTWGVLKLTLHTRSYDWEFVPIDGHSFRDAGSDQCR
jgi:hypothetical protein